MGAIEEGHITAEEVSEAFGMLEFVIDNADPQAVMGNLHDRVAAVWDAMDQDDNGILSEEEMIFVIGAAFESGALGEGDEWIAEQFHKGWEHAHTTGDDGGATAQEFEDGIKAAYEAGEFSLFELEAVVETCEYIIEYAEENYDSIVAAIEAHFAGEGEEDGP